MRPSIAKARFAPRRVFDHAAAEFSPVLPQNRVAAADLIDEA
jgi:hypothetical protein